MADGIQLNAGALGDVLAADEVGGVKWQRVKLGHGADGSALDVSTENPLPVALAPGIPVPLPLVRYLDTNGDGTGTKNANGDYSVTPATFKLAPAAGEVFCVTRLIVFVEDTAGFAAAEYGNIGVALPNGVACRVHNGAATVVDLVDGLPITSNAEWARLCYDADLKAWGAGNEYLVARWTFAKLGTVLRLDGDATEALEVVLSDDLSGLVGHYFLAEGYVETSLT